MKKITDSDRYVLRVLHELRIGSSQKAQLALVFLGYKPAIEIDVFTNNDTPEQVQKHIHFLGLYSRQIAPNPEIKNSVATFLVAKEKENVDLLQQVIDLRDSKEQMIEQGYHIFYGTLMGYPDTAVLAFVQQKLLSTEEQVEKEKFFEPLCVFRFSKQHWEKELNVVRKWRQALMAACPDILSELESAFIKS